MMNQFAAAAAVNNKNNSNGLDGLSFPQQGMLNPQTLMYQNQLMYQASFIITTWLNVIKRESYSNPSFRLSKIQQLLLT